MLNLALMSLVLFMLERLSTLAVLLLERTNQGIYGSVGWMEIVQLIKQLCMGGPNLRQANYVNNFNITCSKSNVTFDLKCSTDNKNEMIRKSIQGIKNTTFKHYLFTTLFFIYSDIQAKDSQPSS